LIFALIFKYSSIPDKIEQIKEKTEEIKIVGDKKTVWQYPQMWLGMIAIFVYVGVEVATASNLPEYLRQHLDLPSDSIAPFISLYWASLMIGRWTASVTVFNISEPSKRLFKFVMPFVAFGFFLSVLYITGHDIHQFYYYPVAILFLIIAELASNGKASRQLLIFSIAGILALITGMMTTGMVSAYAFISVGLFCSTLWPCIFTLAIRGLGRHTNEGSGLLIMMIMGGGIISLLQGYLASDHLLGIRFSYLTGVVCFLYLAWYAIKAQTTLKSQGLSDV
jgi:FHS family L-fucose permease-like MFS transporter